MAPTAPKPSKMTANDVDVFFGESRTGSFKMSGPPSKHDVAGVGLEVNLDKMENFSVELVLENNDINVTAFAIGVQTASNVDGFQLEFRVKPSFWIWFHFKHHVLKATQPQTAKAKTLVRLAHKSWKMGFPFNDGGIDPESKMLPTW